MARKQAVRSSSASICVVYVCVALGPCIDAIPPAEAARHAVAREHPRLLGSRERLQMLARQRPEAYKRTVRVAREQKADDHAKMISMALVCAIERDAQLGNSAVQMAMKYVNGPIRKGHTPFAHDLARCAVVYDLCHEYWAEQQRAKFHEYMNKTVDANVRSETHVFHNGWYGYKHWGIGLACYASYYDNPRARDILGALEQEWRNRAAPALELAGDGGGWAEGYYVNYWLYEWLFFCEAARYCEGLDYYATAPGFFKNRAVATMFESYPGIKTYNSRRPVPMGDGGGRTFGGDRDKVLSARRILVNYLRDDPAHRIVHAFNETTPRSAVGVYAYKDFLWRDTTVEKGDLKGFRLSHFSPGPGYVYARSSWDEDATYFFFKCGDRFTAHQHLDVGHFLVYKHEELAGDGGHYDSFGSNHDVNYHLRTIAHNTILVDDPSETWSRIRAGPVSGNDGGQHHSWP
ncbi:MAG: heparinase II/III domain-containing protein, partial [Planctomycetota bacterium]